MRKLKIFFFSPVFIFINFDLKRRSYNIKTLILCERHKNKNSMTSDAGLSIKIRENLYPVTHWSSIQTFLVTQQNRIPDSAGNNIITTQRYMVSITPLRNSNRLCTCPTTCDTHIEAKVLHAE